MKKTSILMSLLFALLLVSCGSMIHRGVVAMKIDNSTAHIGLNSDEVNIGDHLQLYTNNCTPGTRTEGRKCVKISKGHGVVTQKLGPEYIEVKFNDGVTFQEGDIVEKHAH